jgi:hypothetical protein
MAWVWRSGAGAEKQIEKTGARGDTVVMNLAGDRIKWADAECGTKLNYQTKVPRDNQQSDWKRPTGCSILIRTLITCTFLSGK